MKHQHSSIFRQHLTDVYVCYRINPHQSVTKFFLIQIFSNVNVTVNKYMMRVALNKLVFNLHLHLSNLVVLPFNLKIMWPTMLNSNSNSFFNVGSELEYMLILWDSGVVSLAIIFFEFNSNSEQVVLLSLQQTTWWKCPGALWNSAECCCKAVQNLSYLKLKH